MRGSLVSRDDRLRICGILAAVRARLVRKFREKGIRGAIRALWSRLRDALYSDKVSIVMVKDLGEAVPPRFSTGITVESLRREHLPLLADLNRERDSPRDDKRFAGYVDAGFSGYVAMLDGVAIGYYWWVDASNGARFPDLRDDETGIELGPGEVYGSDFFLREAQRNGRVAGEMLSAIEADLRERGYSRLWGYVRADNRPARWLYSSRGYEPLWTHTRKKRLWMTRIELSPDPRNNKGGTDVDR